MNRFLASLSQKDRVIFLRRYWFCDTIREIAQRFGLRDAQVKRSLSHTCTRLAAFRQQEGL